MFFINHHPSAKLVFSEQSLRVFAIRVQSRVQSLETRDQSNSNEKLRALKVGKSVELCSTLPCRRLSHTLSERRAGLPHNAQSLKICVKMFTQYICVWQKCLQSTMQNVSTFVLGQKSSHSRNFCVEHKSSLCTMHILHRTHSTYILHSTLHTSSHKICDKCLNMMNVRQNKGRDS